MTQPIAASKFISSIGVNTDLDFFDTPYANAAAVAADIAYLGITVVRDILPATDAFSLAPYAALAAEGVKFDLIAGVGGFGLPMTMAALKAELDAFVTKYPGSVASVEGPNEPNIYPFSYLGHSGVAAAVSYQTDLYKLVTSDPLLKGVAVANFAFGGVGSDIYTQAGNENAIADSGNIHVYPDGEGTSAPQSEILNEQSLAAVSTAGKPMAMTEFGYSTYAGGDITQAAQAAYELDGLLDAAADGISKTYLYELVDGDTGSTGYEENFGLFQSDATTPKAVAVSIHNLTSILADGGSTLPGGTLNYSVSGLTAAGGNTLLMQKSNGAFDLAVWSEPTAASLKTAHDAVTVALGATYATVKVFDPTVGTAPVSTLQNVSSVSLDVTGHPLIVEVEPALAVTTPAVTTPAVTTPAVTTPAVTTPVVTTPVVTTPVVTTPVVTTPVVITPVVTVTAPTPVVTPVVTVPVLTTMPSPNKSMHISATQGQTTIAVNRTTITSTSGNHVIFLTGTGDVLKATGGAETVTALQGGNAITTGGGNDTINFGPRSTVDAGGGTNTLNDSGTGSTIVLPEAGKGIDLIHGAIMKNGDVFDLRDMLQVTTWSGVSNSDLGNYIHIRSAANGADSIISVARNGSFASGSNDVAHLYGTGALSLATLLAHSVTT